MTVRAGDEQRAPEAAHITVEVGDLVVVVIGSIVLVIRSVIVVRAELAVDHLTAECGGDDQRREHDQLHDQDAAVVGFLQRLDAADLPVALERAGDHERDHAREREPGEAHEHRAHLVGILPRHHDREHHDEATEPARHRADVDRVGGNRDRDPAPTRRVPGERGGIPEGGRIL